MDVLNLGQSSRKTRKADAEVKKLAKRPIFVLISATCASETNVNSAGDAAKIFRGRLST